MDAFKPILEALGIHVLTRFPEEPSNCLLPLYNSTGQVFAQVAAVPYLRPVDLPAAPSGEELDEGVTRIVRAIETVYATVTNAAEKNNNRDLIW